MGHQPGSALSPPPACTLQRSRLQLGLLQAFWEALEEAQADWGVAETGP